MVKSNILIPLLVLKVIPNYLKSHQRYFKSDSTLQNINLIIKISYFITFLSNINIKGATGIWTYVVNPKGAYFRQVYYSHWSKLCGSVASNSVEILIWNLVRMHNFRVIAAFFNNIFLHFTCSLQAKLFLSVMCPYW